MVIFLMGLGVPLEFQMYLGVLIKEKKVCVSTFKVTNINFVFVVDKRLHTLIVSSILAKKDSESQVLKTCLPKSLKKFQNENKFNRMMQPTCDVIIPDFKRDRSKV